MLGRRLQSHSNPSAQQQRNLCTPRQKLLLLLPTQHSTQIYRPHRPPLQAPRRSGTPPQVRLSLQLQWRPVSPLQPRSSQQTAPQRQTPLHQARRRKAFSLKARNCLKSWDPARKNESGPLTQGLHVTLKALSLSSLFVSVGSRCSLWLSDLIPVDLTVSNYTFALEHCLASCWIYILLSNISLQRHRRCM